MKSVKFEQKSDTHLLTLDLCNYLTSFLAHHPLYTLHTFSHTILSTLFHFMYFYAFLTLDSKCVLRFFSFSCLIFIYLSTQTHIHTHARIPPIEWHKLLLCGYSICKQPHKYDLVADRLYHVVRWFWENVFYIKVYLRTTDVVQPHQGTQQCSKLGFLPQPDLKQ